MTEQLGIPVTTPARTLSDMRATCPAWDVRRATRQAEFLELPLGEIEADGGAQRSQGRLPGALSSSPDPGEEQVNEDAAAVAADLRDALGLAS